MQPGIFLIELECCCCCYLSLLPLWDLVRVVCARAVVKNLDSCGRESDKLHHVVVFVIGHAMASHPDGVSVGILDQYKPNKKKSFFFVLDIETKNMSRKYKIEHTSYSE